MEEIEKKEPILTAQIRNFISLDTLKSLIGNAEKLQRYSFRDDTFRKIFLHPGEGRLPGFAESGWIEMQDLVKIYEENERKLKIGKEIPQIQLRWYKAAETKGKLIAPSRHLNYYGPEKFAPIIDLKISTIIAAMIGYADEETPKLNDLNSIEIHRVKDVLYDLKVLYNFTPLALDKIFEG